jgi:hypothetical protein
MWERLGEGAWCGVGALALRAVFASLVLYVLCVL